MIERRDDELTPAEKAAREALGALPSPRPDAAYRARVARAFVSGNLRSTVRTRPLFARMELWSLVGAAAAMVVVAFALNRGPDWRVIEAHGAGNAVLNGRALAMQGEEFARELRRGGHLVLPKDASLDIVAPGELAMNVEGGTDMVLPAAPNRWWSRASAGKVTLGSAFISTGRAFHGATLAMVTPEATAHVVGTSLAVLRDREAGTCVCVMEGKVRVSYEEDKEFLDVPAGKRCICPLEGEAEIGPILHYSEHALHRLNEKSATALDR